IRRTKYMRDFLSEFQMETGVKDET
ncbi:MAG: HD domain-containing protein, partial [Lactobacillus iners]|nr:HD domain-containing protein [Lactobacillus iners]MCT7765186.1 HD domain-containing protein [Lactobacillus iners]MCT7791978.1 HD domain-containing protein [Lactobacillus iners]MCT7848606.1 HD domain-containing protein [Lactobacillus iners]